MCRPVPIITRALLVLCIGTTSLVFTTGSSQAGMENQEPINALDILRQVVKMTQRFQEDRQKLKMLQEIATLQEKAGDLLAAQKTYSEVRDLAGEINRKITPIPDSVRGEDRILEISSRVKLLNEIATIQRRVGDFTGATRTFGHAVQSTEKLPIDRSPQGRIEALKDIAKAQVKSGDQEGARETTETLIKVFDLLGGDPNQVLVSYKITYILEIGLDKFDQYKTSSLIRKDLEEATGLEDLWIRSLVYRDISIIQARLGDYEGAMETYSKMVKVRTLSSRRTPRPEITLNNTLDLLDLSIRLIESGEKDEARQVLGKAIKMIKGLDETEKMSRIRAWAKVAIIYARLRDIENALEAIKHVPDGAYRPEVLINIVKAQIRMGDLKGAHHTALILGDNKLLSEVAVSYATAGDLTSAFQALDELGDKLILRTPALRSIARERVRSGNPKEAFAWAVDLNSEREKAAALLGVVEGLLKTKI